MRVGSTHDDCDPGAAALPSGAPIDGAIAKVFLGDADVGKQAVAHASGHYVLAGIHSGTVFVGASASGYVTRIQPVTMTADAQLDLRSPANPSAAQ